MLTELEIRTLSQKNEGKRWSEIPETCPERFRVQICEYRKAVLNGTVKESRVMKSLHSTAIKAVSEQEKMRLRLIAEGLL